MNTFANASILAAALALAGCSSSGEAVPPKTAPAPAETTGPGAAAPTGALPSDRTVTLWLSGSKTEVFSPELLM